MREILEDAEGAAARGDVGPGKSNREIDAQKFPKRFYEAADVGEKDGEFLVLLDGKPVKTPGKRNISLPNVEAARLVADEWGAIEKDINPLLLPVTRLANTALDGVSNEMQAVKEDIVRFASSDLLCYRATAPEGLVNMQQEHWDPILDWYAETKNARFEIGEGIVHIAQPKDAVANFSSLLTNYHDPIQLTCLHTFTSISGSALIALALAEAHLGLDAAWSAAHVDEDWNISLWGEDWEAKERREQRWKDFRAAERLFATI